MPRMIYMVLWYLNHFNHSNSVLFLLGLFGVWFLIFFFCFISYGFCLNYVSNWFHISVSFPIFLGGILFILGHQYAENTVLTNSHNLYSMLLALFKYDYLYANLYRRSQTFANGSILQDNSILIMPLTSKNKQTFMNIDVYACFLHDFVVVVIIFLLDIVTHTLSYASRLGSYLLFNIHKVHTTTKCTICMYNMYDAN